MWECGAASKKPALVIKLKAQAGRKT